MLAPTPGGEKMLFEENPRRYRLAIIASSLTVLLAACGSENDNTDALVSDVRSDSSTQPDGTPPAGSSDTAGAANSIACSVDTSVKLAYEELRLETALPYSGNNVIGTDTTPLADRILQATGFDQFAPDFANVLCDENRRTTIASFEAARTLVHKEGATLWKSAVDRVQGRWTSAATESLPNSDDRMLYWARVKMTKALRQWRPDFTLSEAQKDELQWEFERASRGQYDINFPEGSSPDRAMYRRLIMSGFDVFTLGTPGTPNTGLRNGNPSGATALAMDGKQYTLPDGTILAVETYILPVSYDPFHKGMQEDTLGPYFRPGPQQVDASITMSQGGRNVFWLEQHNARFHGPSAGNDGIIYCPPGDSRIPGYVQPIGARSGTDERIDPISLPGSGCDIYPVARWLGYDSVSYWQKDFPPQFVDASLPVAAMITARTNEGIARPPGAVSEGTDGFDVTWHTSYSYFQDCNLPDTISIPSNNLMNTLPDLASLTPPQIAWCSRSGGGGSYLSNESAYRNTLFR